MIDDEPMHETTSRPFGPADRLPDEVRALRDELAGERRRRAAAESRAGDLEAELGRRKAELWRRVDPDGSPYVPDTRPDGQARVPVQEQARRPRCNEPCCQLCGDCT
ncbi:hypothetical protein OJF2_03830 [Aquisphaera giovannonii]|uniref:Uncharacterized protein n=1 Tax=Aquisphaera giovannonii TaxID=406548 RepID=A0A5B9VTR4_9BACT|nr:hypothetical protein [Aquisphaera giovannonii]QEH31916.1 hypothetical protein OJF2_03830 [Aquisphaera giovannonii]